MKEHPQLHSQSPKLTFLDSSPCVNDLYTFLSGAVVAVLPCFQHAGSFITGQLGKERGLFSSTLGRRIEKVLSEGSTGHAASENRIRGLCVVPIRLIGVGCFAIWAVTPWPRNQPMPQ